MPVKPALRDRYAWSIHELARLLGCSGVHLYNNVVDADGQRVQASTVAPDGQVWIRFAGQLIPARKGVNGGLTILRRDLETALGDTARLHPAGRR